MSNIVSMVANLQKAHDYYKQQAEDAKGIIKQLVEGPGEIEYIHPFDLYELTNVLTLSSDYIDVFINQNDDKSIIEICRTGKKYKQSFLMPCKTKNIK